MAGEGADVQSIVAQADQLFKEEKWPETLECLMKFSDTREPELLWRLVRVHFKLSKQDSTPAAEQKRLADEGLKFAERGLEVDDKNSNCQKWFGMMLGRSSQLGDNKLKVENAHRVREHYQKALELNSADPSRHFSYANIPWLKRKMAGVAVGALPTTTNEEALSFLDAAEKAEPGFSSTNWLLLGKVHQAMGHKEEARKWLKQAAEQEPRDSDEKEAQAEAATLVKKL